METIRKRTSKEGKVSFQAQVRLRGHPPETATFTRLTDARKWANATEQAIIDGRYFENREAKKHTVVDMVDRYIREALPSKAESKKQESQLKWWKKEIGAYTLADVTPRLLSEQRDKLATGITRRKTARSPATVVRYMAALSVKACDAPICERSLFFCRGKA